MSVEVYEITPRSAQLYVRWSWAETLFIPSRRPPGRELQRQLVGQSGRWPMAANQAAKVWLPAGGGKSTPNVSFWTWRTHTSDPLLPLDPSKVQRQVSDAKLSPDPTIHRQ